MFWLLSVSQDLVAPSVLWSSPQNCLERSACLVTSSMHVPYHVMWAECSSASAMGQHGKSSLVQALAEPLASLLWREETWEVRWLRRWRGLLPSPWRPESVPGTYTGEAENWFSQVVLWPSHMGWVTCTPFCTHTTHMYTHMCCDTCTTSTYISSTCPHTK